MRALAAGGVGPDVDPLHQRQPGVGSQQPRQHRRIEVVLPAPFGPTRP